MMHFVYTSITVSFHTSPKRTSSFKCENIGKKSLSYSRPAVCTIFSAILFRSCIVKCNRWAQKSTMPLSYASIRDRHSKNMGVCRNLRLRPIQQMQVLENIEDRKLLTEEKKLIRGFIDDFLSSHHIFLRAF